MTKIAAEGNVPGRRFGMLAFVLFCVIPLLHVCVYAASRTYFLQTFGLYLGLILGPALIAVAVYLFFSRARFVAALTVLIPAEVLCAVLAFHTLGELDSLMLLLLTWGNVAALALLKYRRAGIAMGLVVIVALLILPYQLFLGYRWLDIRSEAAGIIIYAESHRQQKDKYPEDLSQYTFENSTLRANFQYEADARGKKSFTLTYYIGTPDTSHWYTPEEGWKYYPD